MAEPPRLPYKRITELKEEARVENQTVKSGCKAPLIIIKQRLSQDTSNAAIPQNITKG